jgi:hypothetical protein
VVVAVRVPRREPDRGRARAPDERPPASLGRRLWPSTRRGTHGSPQAGGSRSPRRRARRSAHQNRQEVARVAGVSSSATPVGARSSARSSRSWASASPPSRWASAASAELRASRRWLRATIPATIASASSVARPPGRARRRQRAVVTQPQFALDVAVSPSTRFRGSAGNTTFASTNGARSGKVGSSACNRTLLVRGSIRWTTAPWIWSAGSIEPIASVSPRGEKRRCWMTPSRIRYGLPSGRRLVTS